jgi:hypothetical protein
MPSADILAPLFAWLVNHLESTREDDFLHVLIERTRHGYVGQVDGETLHTLRLASPSPSQIVQEFSDRLTGGGKDLITDSALDVPTQTVRRFGRPT